MPPTTYPHVLLEDVRRFNVQLASQLDDVDDSGNQNGIVDEPIEALRAHLGDDVFEHQFLPLANQIHSKRVRLTWTQNIACVGAALAVLAGLPGLGLGLASQTPDVAVYSLKNIAAWVLGVPGLFGLVFSTMAALREEDFLRDLRLPST